MADRRGDITRLMAQIAEGGPERRKAKEDLARLIYDKLRGLAHHELWKHRRDIWQTTALVQEVWINVVERRGTKLGDKKSEYLIVAFVKAVRNIMVDHHRRIRPINIDLNPDTRPVEEPSIVERFIRREADEKKDAALRELEREHPLEYEAVALRWILGLKPEEIGEVLDVPLWKVKRALAFGIGYLRTKIRRNEK